MSLLDAYKGWDFQTYNVAGSQTVTNRVNCANGGKETSTSWSCPQHNVTPS